MRYFIIGISIFVFLGCNEDAVQKTKELNGIKEKSLSVVKQKPQKSQKLQMAELKVDNTLKLEQLKKSKEENLAKIEAQKEQKLKELELAKEKEKIKELTKQKNIEANSSIELAKINAKTIVEVKDKEFGFYKIVAIVALFMLFILLVLRYLHGVAKRKHEAHLKEQELNYQAYMSESKLKHENISKMLEIISDEKSDSAIKKEITKILTHNKSNLIEHKKKL